MISSSRTIDSHGGFAKDQLRLKMEKNTDKNQIENLIYSLDKSINMLTTIDARDVHKESIPCALSQVYYGPIVIGNCRDLMVKYGPGPSGDTSGLNQSALQENKNKSDLEMSSLFLLFLWKIRLDTVWTRTLDISPSC